MIKEMQERIKNKAIKKKLSKDGKKLLNQGDDDDDSDVSINSDNTREEGI
jgi:hypothetical protein